MALMIATLRSSGGDFSIIDPFVGFDIIIDENAVDDRNVEITLSPWILLTEDEDVLVTPDWIVTIVEPLNSIVEMYQEKVNGQVD